jgi:ABC-2 type transport system ATP-binding protein
MTTPAILEFDGVRLDVFGRAGLRELCRLRLTGPRRTVLDGVQVRLSPGERVVVLGPNGSGKTTLLRAAAGVLSPASGHVRVHGRVGWGVTDERAFHRRLTMRAHLALACALRGAPASEVDRVAQACGLGSELEQPLDACSTGQRARLGLARALVGAPEVLLLDEVERGLDAEGRAALAARLSARDPSLVVYATHDTALAALATRVLRVDAGRVTLEAT